eukprot:5089220-Prymnesium_polylepis.1
MKPSSPRDSGWSDLNDLEPHLVAGPPASGVPPRVSLAAIRRMDDDDAFWDALTEEDLCAAEAPQQP